MGCWSTATVHRADPKKLKPPKRTRTASNAPPASWQVRPVKFGMNWPIVNPLFPFTTYRTTGPPARAVRVLPAGPFPARRPDLQAGTLLRRWTGERRTRQEYPSAKVHLSANPMQTGLTEPRGQPESPSEAMLTLATAGPERLGSKFAAPDPSQSAEGRPA